MNGIATDFDLEGYIADGDLRRGDYVMEIDRAEDVPDKGYLGIFGQWLEGPEDTNGKPIEGREAVIFLTTKSDRIAAYPSLVRRTKNVLKKFVDVVGSDPDEMAGQTVALSISVRARANGGQNIDVTDVRRPA